MIICVAGKNDIAVEALLFLLEKYPNLKVVVCPNRHDNGCSSWQPSLKRFATEYGIQVCRLPDLFGVDNLAFFSLEFDQIIVPSRFRSSKLFNVHFSRLPEYKGMYTSCLPILHGKSETGVSLHKIDSGIDTGPLIDQISIDIDPSANCRDLYYTYMENGIKIFKDNLDMMIKGEYNAKDQNYEGASYYSKSAIDFRSICIDTNKTGNEIHQQIRSYYFPEYQVPSIEGWKVKPLDFRSSVSKKTSRAGSVRVVDNLVIVSALDCDISFEKFNDYDLHKAFEYRELSGEMVENYAHLIDIKDPLGRTVLMKSAYQGRTEELELLLKNGANPNLGNANGTTPLMYAKDYMQNSGDSASLELLKMYGADISKRDRFGRTVIDWVRLNGSGPLLKYFEV